MDTKNTSFEKLYLSLRYYLQGKGYYKALEALALAREYHTGKRKDGITPELQHQVEQGLHLTTLKDLIDEEGCIIVALLHDIQEDHDVPSELLIEKFGKELAGSIWTITKKFRGMEKSAVEYYRELANDARASIAKGCDRVHNVQSMMGVFNLKKQRTYIAETITYILPMLKKAGYKFPQQQLAYQNVRQVLKRQCQLVNYMLKEVAAVQDIGDVYAKEIDELTVSLTVRGLELHKAQDRITQLEGELGKLRASNGHGMVRNVIHALTANAQQLPTLLNDRWPNQRYMISDIFVDGLRALQSEVERELVFNKGLTGQSVLSDTKFKEDVLDAGGTKQETVG